VTALQVKGREGRWVGAPPLPGTFVVNIGDMFRVLTNGLYTPTPHRWAACGRTVDRLPLLLLVLLLSADSTAAQHAGHLPACLPTQRPAPPARLPARPPARLQGGQRQWHRQGQPALLLRNQL
jgi:hypothetical protein